MGLGAKGTAAEYRRPRHNPNLETLGVVQLAAGGMCCCALTHDNKILMWRVNDLGALGRETRWDGGMVDMENSVNGHADGSYTEDSESGVDPHGAHAYSNQ